MVNPAVKFPSARQEVFVQDPQTGAPVFTRPWFLFLQAIWQRQGGAVAPDSSDLELLSEGDGVSETQQLLYGVSQDFGQLPVQSFSPETQQLLYGVSQDFGQLPVQSFSPGFQEDQSPVFQTPIDQQVIQTQLDELRDKLAELTKAVNDINQGAIL